MARPVGDVGDNNMMGFYCELCLLLRCITLSVFLDLTCNNFDFSRALCCRFFVRPQAELCSFYCRFSVCCSDGINRISVKRAFECWSYWQF